MPSTESRPSYYYYYWESVLAEYFLQYVDAVTPIISGILRVQHAPVCRQMLQTFRSVEPAAVPHDGAAAPISGLGHGQDEKTTRPDHAPQLRSGFQVAERRQRVAVSTQTAVLQRRVRENDVEPLGSAAGKPFGHLVRRHGRHAIVGDHQLPVLDRGDVASTEIQQHRLRPRSLRADDGRILSPDGTGVFLEKRFDDVLVSVTVDVLHAFQF